jgi:hypothetical protein
MSAERTLDPKGEIIRQMLGFVISSEHMDSIRPDDL